MYSYVDALYTCYNNIVVTIATLKMVCTVHVARMMKTSAASSYRTLLFEGSSQQSVLHTYMYMNIMDYTYTYIHVHVHVHVI